MLNIVLFGPPGAGKGTQSANIINKFNLTHLSTGDILRTEIKNGTDLGIKAKTLMDAGSLVPDDVVIGMIKNKIAENKNSTKGFVFDGFPRTTAQAVALDAMLEEVSMDISAMLALVVEDSELEKRLLNRGLDSGRPDDVNIDIIRRRIGVYKNETSIVADFYRAQNKFFPINGIGSIEQVFDDICKSVESFWL